MAWLKGFNFRATSAYVTDGTNETFVVADVYPVTRNGVTFGWANTAGSIGSRNRSATIDRRLAGINFNEAGGDIFRVDLPGAGLYQINAAFGDHANGQSITAAFQDNTTSFISTTATSVAVAHYLDASFTDWSEAAWPGSNTLISQVFTSSILRIQTGAALNSPVAHLFLTQVDTILPPFPPRPTTLQAM
jgi:hypothetical protein